MKNVLSTIVAALAVSVFSTAVFAAVPCPQGMSCSENYQMQIPQVAKSAEKKELSPEQIATRQKEVSEARKRDLDKTLVYTKTSQTDNCLYWELDSKVDDLLIKNPDIVVDRKEFLSPAFSIERTSTYNGKSYNRCTATLVVHYHRE